MAYSLKRLYADVVQVQHGEIDSFGSGRLIGRSLVLTARHVLQSDDGASVVDKGWQVRLWRAREEASAWGWLEAEVAWQGGADLDLALLKILPKEDEPKLDPTLRTRLGLIDTTRSHRVLGHGFPRGAKLNDRRTLFCPSGQLNDEANLTFSFGIDQSYEPESPREDWRGFSGAAIVLEEGNDPDELWLFGVAQHVAPHFTKRLAVARLSTAWNDGRFREILSDANVPIEPPTDPVPAEFWRHNVVGQTLKKLGLLDQRVKGIARAREQLRARVSKDFVDAPLQRRLLGGEFLEIPFLRRSDLEYVPEPIKESAASSRKDPTAETDLSNLFSELNDHSSRQVLITGEPGAGKSMMLLECARRSLATNAGNDEHALPVIVQLSYWTTQSLKKSGKREDLIASFRDWLVGQLVETYKVHESYVKCWLEDGDLELYLDGLDEAPHQARALCATCLSAFQNAYTGPVFLACRRAEFEALAGSIQPDIVVEVQPLTDAQVTEFVNKNKLTALQRVIDSNEGLFQLSRSPLMLSVMTFVYQSDEDSTEQDIVPTTNGLFAAYVDKAFERRARSHSVHKKISREDTIHAVKLVARSYDFTRNAVFFLSDISSQWFTRRWQKFAAMTLLFLPIISLVGGLNIMSFNRNGGNLVALIMNTIWGLMIGSVVIYASIESVPLYGRVKWHTRRGMMGAGIGILLSIGLAIWQVAAVLVAVGLVFLGVAILVNGLIWWALGVIVVGAVALWMLTDISPISVIQAVIAFFAVPYLLLTIVGWITTGDWSPNSLLHSVSSAAGDNVSESLVWSSFKVVGLTIWTCFRFLALLLALVGFLIGATTVESPEHLKQVEGSIIRMFVIAAALGMMSSVASVLVLWLLEYIAGRTIDSAWQLRYVALVAGTLVFGFCGGVRSVAYYVVRMLLVLGHSLPVRYGDLLDFAVDAGILIRAGSGYAFIHKLEQEYFAQLPERRER